MGSGSAEGSVSAEEGRMLVHTGINATHRCSSLSATVRGCQAILGRL